MIVIRSLNEMLTLMSFGKLISFEEKKIVKIPNIHKYVLIFDIFNNLEGETKKTANLFNKIGGEMQHMQWMREGFEFYELKTQRKTSNCKKIGK